MLKAMLRIAALFVLTSAFVGVGSAQRVLVPTQCQLTGYVINALTAVPINNAHIELRSLEPSSQSQLVLQTITATNGTFSLSGMHPGRYRVSVARVGFLESATDLGPLFLTPGQTSHDVKIQLLPQAVITGTILQSNGEPLSGALVAAVPAGGAGQRYVYANDLGEYRLYGLSPGSYYIRASHRGVKDSTYYPKTTRLEDALSLKVAPGTLLTGIDVVTSFSITETDPPSPNALHEQISSFWATVEGQAVNTLTRAPLLRVRVSLDKISNEGEDASPGRSTSVSDAAGHFRFNNIKPGVYRLRAAAIGFFAAPTGTSPTDTFSNLVLAPGQSIKDVTLKLTPAGVIVGKISDEDGEPLANATVMAISLSLPMGHQEFTVARRVYTNDLGEYRLHGLLPGRYYVVALCQNSQEPAVVAAENTEHPGDQQPSNREIYPPTYFPNASYLSEATPLSLGAGGVLGGINLTLSPVAKVHLRGHVLAPSHIALTHPVLVSLTPADLWTTAKYTRRGAEAKRITGEFALSGVSPGAYLLSAHWADDGKQFSSRQMIHVGKSDLDDVVLTLSPARNLTGQVRVEGQEGFSLPTPQVSLHTIEQGIMAAGGEETLRRDGSFTLENLPPDRYRVSLSGLVSNYYLKSVYFRSLDVTLSGINLTDDAPGTVELVLSPAGGSIDGTVAGGQSATVALIPDPALREGRELYRTVDTDSSGRFGFRGIAPGRYQLIAAEDLDSTPASLLTADHVTAVTIEENRTEHVQISLVHADPF